MISSDRCALIPYQVIACNHRDESSSPRCSIGTDRRRLLRSRLRWRVSRRISDTFDVASLVKERLCCAISSRRFAWRCVSMLVIASTFVTNRRERASVESRGGRENSRGFSRSTRSSARDFNNNSNSDRACTTAATRGGWKSNERRWAGKKDIIQGLEKHASRPSRSYLPPTVSFDSPRGGKAQLSRAIKLVIRVARKLELRECAAHVEIFRRPRAT